jgi:hypothetical protein
MTQMRLKDGKRNWVGKNWKAAFLSAVVLSATFGGFTAYAQDSEAELLTTEQRARQLEVDTMRSVARAFDEANERFDDQNKPNGYAGGGLQVGGSSEGRASADLQATITGATDPNERYQLRYGHGHLDLGLGSSGLSIGIQNHSGLDLSTAIPGVMDNQEATVLPILGLELANIDAHLNTARNQNRLDYFEWSPQVAAGARVRWNEACGVSARVTAGASVGTLGERAGGGGAVGVHGEAECDNRFLVTGSHQRVRGNNSITRVTASVPVSRHLAVGAQYSRIASELETEAQESLGVDRQVENRVTFTAGVAF